MTLLKSRIFANSILIDLLILMLSSCASSTSTINPTVTAKIKTVTSEITPADTPTLEPVDSPTFKPEESPVKQQETIPSNMRDIEFAVSLNFSGNSRCVFDNQGQISVFSIQKMTEQFVLNDSQIDYRDPVWSPDGKWIAFVVSQPYRRPTGSSQSYANEKGSDSIWIARPNGSDMHQVSSTLPSEIDFNQFSCQSPFGIASAPRWSPDGKYIAFLYHHVQQDGGNIVLDYYLVDLISGKTTVLMENQWGNGWWGEPYWVNEKTIIFESVAQGEGMGIMAGIYVLSDVGASNMHTYLISFPVDISLVDKNNGGHRFLINHEDKLFMSFPFSEMPASATRKTQIWSLDVVSSVWTKTAILNNWGTQGIGNKSFAICDPINQEVAVYNTESWDLVGQIVLDPKMICYEFIVTFDKNGSDFGYLYSIDGEKTKVYSINLGNLKQEPRLLFDNSLFPWMHPNPYVKLAVQSR